MQLCVPSCTCLCVAVYEPTCSAPCCSPAFIWSNSSSRSRLNNFTHVCHRTNNIKYHQHSMCGSTKAVVQANDQSNGKGKIRPHIYEITWTIKLHKSGNVKCNRIEIEKSKGVVTPKTTPGKCTGHLKTISMQNQLVWSFFIGCHTHTYTGRICGPF